MSNVTLKDIARKAGVSAMTVSASLHGTGRVSEERSAKIRSIARSLGYQPSLAAQLLSRKHSGQIGLLVNCSSTMKATDVGATGFSAPILASFVQVCEQEKQPYHIEYHMPPEVNSSEVQKLGVGGDDTSAEDSEFIPPRQITGGLVDGALVIGHPTKQLANWFENSCQCPLVYIDEQGPYSVTSAVDDGIKQAVMHLAALGHRRIAYIGGPTKYITHQLGYNGFKEASNLYSLKAYSKNWIAEIYDVQAEEETQEIQNRIEKWWQQKIKPTAIVVHGVAFARVVTGVLLQMGVAIPQQVSVIAYGAAGDCQRSYPMLSSIEIDHARMVEQAVVMLKKRIGKLTVPQSDLSVVPNLTMRQTVAPPSTK